MKKQDFEKQAEEVLIMIDPEAKVEVDDTKGWWVRIASPNSGRLIGRGGETLKALQHVIRLMFAKKSGENIPVTVDVAGYKENRANELEELAKSMAENVHKSGYAQEMRPMTPYERRVVHTALAGAEGVKVYSVGDGQARRIRIEPEEK